MHVEATDFLVDLADMNRTKTSSSRCSSREGDVLVRSNSLHSRQTT